jgi:preprotein translocase subunit YajC
MGGMGMMLLLLLPMFFFLMWSQRSQTKKQAATIAALQKGDRVILQSGLIGKLVETGERTAKVEIASGVKVEVLKSAISGKDGGDATVVANKQ